MNSALAASLPKQIGLAVDLGIDAAIGLDLLAHRTTHRANHLFNPFTAFVAVRAGLGRSSVPERPMNGRFRHDSKRPI